jgi:hypothetical protein
MIIDLPRIAWLPPVPRTCRGMPCHSTHGASLALEGNVILCWWRREVTIAGIEIYRFAGVRRCNASERPRLSSVNALPSL